MRGAQGNRTVTEHAVERKLGFTRVLGIVAAVVFNFGILFALVQHGTFERIWHDLVIRPSGPFGSRFILQPLMAIIIAMLFVKKGIRHGR
jgi:hypothetical protein